MSGYQLPQDEQIFRRADLITYHKLIRVDVMGDGNVLFILEREFKISEDEIPAVISGEELIKNWRRVVSRSSLF